MRDIAQQLDALRRPRLLVRAARSQVANYSRQRDLTRIFGSVLQTNTGELLMKLLSLELEHNHLRLSGDTGYIVARHIDVLIALMGEAEIFKARLRAAPPLSHTIKKGDDQTGHRPCFSPLAGA